MANFKCFMVFSSILVLLLPSLSWAQLSPNRIFILAGQSNMAGRGGVQKIGNNRIWNKIVPPASTPNGRIRRFNAASQWEQAREPLHFDIDFKKTNGIGPGMPFANELLSKAGEKVGVIGLVPCAIGGTHITEWSKGTVNYTRLVDRIKASEKSGGKVAAFLWYQGESDASVKEDARLYESNLAKFFSDLRGDLNRPNLPIIMVKIASFDTYVNPVINYMAEVRMAQEAVSKKLPNIKTVDAMEVVKSNSPGFNPDNCHLNSESQIIVGKKLARSYLLNFGGDLFLEVMPEHVTLVVSQGENCN